MKAHVVTELALLVAVACLLYLYWAQQGELDLIGSDVDAMRRQIGDLTKPPAPKPTAPRKPKETTT